VPPPPPPSAMESTIPHPLGGPSSGPRGRVFGSARIRLVPRRAGASITLLREPPPEAFESGAIRIIDRDATYRGYISADGRANSNRLALEVASCARSCRTPACAPRCNFQQHTGYIDRVSSAGTCNLARGSPGPAHSSSPWLYLAQAYFAVRLCPMVPFLGCLHQQLLRDYWCARANLHGDRSAYPLPAPCLAHLDVVSVAVGYINLEAYEAGSVCAPFSFPTLACPPF
jgi:hypothetical protein